MTDPLGLEHLDVDPTAAPPAGQPYASALWLIARHPRLAASLALVPGAIDDRGYDPDPLERAFISYDAVQDGAWPDAHSGALTAMPSTERQRLRLLAALGTNHVAFSLPDVDQLDPGDHALLADWAHTFTSYRPS